MAYLLDSNVFIEGKNRYYGLDFCPAFWDWLRAENTAGHVFSIEKVGDELAAGGDELSTWAAARDADSGVPGLTPTVGRNVPFRHLSVWRTVTTAGWPTSATWPSHGRYRASSGKPSVMCPPGGP